MEYRDLTASEISDEAIRRMMLDADNGEKLPPERELVDQLGISRTTLRSTLVKLRDSGELTSHARGSRIRKKATLNILAMQSMTKELSAEGNHVDVQEIYQSKSAGDSAIQAFFHISGHTLLEMHRVYSVNKIPFTYEVAYIQLDKFPGIENLNFNNTSLYKLLSDRYGANPAYGREEVSATMATDTTSSALNVAANTPLFKIRSLTYDSNDEPFEYSIQYLVGSEARYILSATNIFDYQEDEEGL